MSSTLSQTASALLQQVRERAAEVKQAATDIVPLCKKWSAAAQTLVPAWSGSYFGYHSELYFKNFERPSLEYRFSPEWGGVNGLPPGWKTRTPEEVKAKMQALAGVEIETIESKTKDLLSPVKALWDELIIELSGLHSVSGFEKEKELLGQIENFKWGISRGEYAHENMPSHFVTRDSEAMNQGVRLSAHLFYESVAAECASRRAKAEEFLKLAQRVLRPLETAAPDLPVGSHTANRLATGKRIFIGHGRSLVWLQLKDFLTSRLDLQCDEFNEESVAGKATVARLNQMLDDAQFAFLVMTAEDRHADDTAHARENVIHEAGLFQGRLGFERAIILLEHGCTEFSNIHGLTVIKFPKDKLDSGFEEIRRVLEREKIIPHA